MLVAAQQAVVSSAMAAAGRPCGSKSLTSSNWVSAWVGAIRFSASSWRQFGSFLAAGIAPIISSPGPRPSRKQAPGRWS